MRILCRDDAATDSRTTAAAVATFCLHNGVPTTVGSTLIDRGIIPLNASSILFSPSKRVLVAKPCDRSYSSRVHPVRTKFVCLELPTKNLGHCCGTMDVDMDTKLDFMGFMYNFPPLEMSKRVQQRCEICGERTRTKNFGAVACRACAGTF